MINLLPLEQIEELKQEENLKQVLIWGILILFFLVSLFLILLSIKFFLSGNLEAQKIFLKEKGSSLNLESEKEIKNLNELLLKMNSFYQEKIDLVPIIEEVSETLPSGIYLTNLNINPISKKEIEVSLSGFCPQRETLLGFITILKEKFSDVSFPPENLLKLIDINFSINFKIKPR